MAQIVSAIESAVRPAAKQLIKGGLVVTNTLSNLAAGTGEEFRSLVTEARADLRRPRVVKISHTQTSMEWLRDHLVKASQGIYSVASSIMSTANAGIVALMVWITGESTEQAQKQVEKGEKALEHLGEELATDESANVIETLVLAAA